VQTPTGRQNGYERRHVPLPMPLNTPPITKTYFICFFRGGIPEPAAGEVILCSSRQAQLAKSKRRKIIRISWCCPDCYLPPTMFAIPPSPCWKLSPGLTSRFIRVRALAAARHCVLGRDFQYCCTEGRKFRRRFFTFLSHHGFRNGEGCLEKSSLTLAGFEFVVEEHFKGTHRSFDGCFIKSVGV